MHSPHLGVVIRLGLSDDEFERDAATVQADLERLADILEAPAPRS